MTLGRSLRRGGATVVVALASLLLAGAAGVSAAPTSRIGAVALPAGHVHGKLVSHGQAAPTDQQCRDQIGVPCYSPQEIRHAYGVDGLLNAGNVGAGQTIVIIDSFGSPTLASDLATFDASYGLPDPPNLTVLAPLGTVPFDVTNDDMTGWAGETTLDVEWAHAMAPGASIVVLTSPVSETEGVQGMPEFLALEQYALDHHLGQIISQSFGATENTLFTPAGRQVFNGFERMYATAALRHVTVLASAGDDGTANVDINMNPYTTPTVIYPGSSPLVTSVGGTSLFADTEGNYQSETVWDNETGATGGGISQTFAEPIYQRLLPPATQRQLGGHRGIPDISWNADPETPILIYLSFLGPDNEGYYFVGGTSEGAPQWAGLVADLNQSIHRPIGFLNPYLYLLGAAGRGRGFHDIVVGNNAFAGVPGYDAAPGWDLATGWGTPNLGQLFSAIAAMPVSS
jgi:subtilase family serine protease